MCRLAPDILHRIARFSCSGLAAPIYRPRFTFVDYCIRLTAPIRCRGIRVCLLSPIPTQFIFPQRIFGAQGPISCFRNRGRSKIVRYSLLSSIAPARSMRLDCRCDHKGAGRRRRTKAQGTMHSRKIKKRRQTHAVRVRKSGAHASSIHDVEALKPAWYGPHARRFDLSRQLRRHSASIWRFTS